MAAITATDSTTFYKCAACSCYFATMAGAMQHQCAEMPQVNTTPADADPMPLDDSVENDENEDKENHGSWNKQNTLLLISEYSKFKDKVEAGLMRKKQMWDKIQQCLKSKGHIFTPDQICGRWKTLMRAYKNTADHNKQSGNSRKTYEYQEELDAIFATDPAITPAYVRSSAKRTFDTCEEEENEQPNDQKENSECSPKDTVKRHRSRSSAKEVVDLFKSFLDDQKKKEEEENERRKEMHTEKMALLRSLVDAISKK